MRPLVSIIIPHWNGIDVIIECLDSLIKVTYPNLEIIVVDNTSPDDSCAMIKEKFPEVKLIANKENVASIRTMFPDFNVTMDELIIAGDYAVMRWTATGTDTGTSDDMLPTGKEVKFSGASILHIVAGKSIETWQYYNNAAILIQLGYTITPPEE